MTGIPPLCIGLPVYDGEAYLPAALDSLLSQSFGDFQVVISDNASTDATAEICRDIAARDPRLRYSRTARNIGAGPNFNRVFAFSQSPFFKWMAHDDMLAPHALSQMMAALADQPKAVLAHSRLTLVEDGGQALDVDDHGRILDRHGRPFHRLEPPHLAEGSRPSQRFGEVLRRMNWCTAIFGVMRTNALRRTHLHGSYYEADRVLLAELALLGRFIQLDEPVIIKRCHAGVSVLKPYAEQARMIDPAVAPLPKGVRLRLGYVRTLTVGRLTWSERMACAMMVLRVSLRNRLSLRIISWLRAL
ncbi:MAG: glycosyltransferase family 2 protein [Rhodospirillaceae bacterium]|nr:glycosyltransferase family 2 protein [Rhodospirillales bacterium]